VSTFDNTLHTVTDDGLQVDEEVTLQLSELIDHDLEGFLDLLDEMTMPEAGVITDDDGDEVDVEGLQEPDYTLLGLGDEPGTIKLRVTGHRDLVA
jgi:hypothetical protein